MEEFHKASGGFHQGACVPAPARLCKLATSRLGSRRAASIPETALARSYPWNAQGKPLQRRCNLGMIAIDSNFIWDMSVENEAGGKAPDGANADGG
jgi:hypothetical protein|tara:strand:+ start:2019 stop:2306 length:288 start_codon:yes stop_codon:yes gene_type:complete